MRLLKYISYSTIDEDVNKFRAMTISLTKANDEPTRIINEINKKYNINNIELILDNLNKELRKVYTGKYEYGLCYESSKKINDIITNKRKIEALTLSLFEANDALSKIKSSLETILKK